MSLGAGRKEIANQCQLGLNRGIGAVELQGFAVGLAGQLGVDVTQVFVCGGIAGVGPDGHLERGASFVKLALSGIEHGQVVVGLGQLGVVFGQLGERADGLCRFARLGLDHALEKAHLRITRLARQILVCLGLGFRQLASTQQLVDICIVVGVGGSSSHRKSESGKAKRPGKGHAGERHKTSCVVRGRRARCGLHWWGDILRWIVAEGVLYGPPEIGPDPQR